MKTTTTVREYDEQGRLVKETVSEFVTPDPVYYQQPCTCGTSGYCVLHGGYRGWWQSPVTCCGSIRTNTTTGVVTTANNAAALS